jgi:hypothetical protein
MANFNEGQTHEEVKQDLRDIGSSVKSTAKKPGIDPVTAGLIGTGVLGTGYIGHRMYEGHRAAKAPLDAAGKAYADKITSALSGGGKVSPELIDEALKNKINLRQVATNLNLSGDEISRLTPKGYHADRLSAGQNFRALGSQIKDLTRGGVKATSGRVYDAIRQGLTEGGGAWRGGVASKLRYLPMGGVAGTLTGVVPEMKDAFHKEDPTGRGRSQTERVGRAVGSIAGGLMGNIPHSAMNRLGGLGGMAGSFLASGLGAGLGAEVLGGAGKLLDKGVSKARGVAAGDVTHQQLRNARKPQTGITPRVPGSKAV